MKVLLDAHAALWLLADHPRLSSRAKRTFEGAEVPVFSMVSLWEIGVKLGLRREDFQLDSAWWRTIPETLVAQGSTRIDVEPVDCREVAILPLHHRDPFDRMLVVQALRLECPILSIDEKFDAYRVKQIW